jgi:hypothetical protein
MQERRTTIDPQGKHGMEHLLGINSAQINPDYVNLSTVQPVVDMAMQGHARIYDPDNERYNIQTVSLGGGAAGVVSEWIISHGNHQSAGNDDLVYDINHTLRIIAIWYMVHINDNALPLDGRSYRIDLQFERGSMGEYVPFWTAQHGITSVPNRPNSQYYHFPGDWFYEQNSVTTDNDYIYVHRWGSGNHIPCPIVPPTWGVKIQASVCSPNPPDAAVWTFPANSFVYIRILAQQVPHGAPIPAYW